MHTKDTPYEGAGIGRLIDAYSDLVDECEQATGLDDEGTNYEFDNDLYIRILLEKILTDSSLDLFDELQPIKNQVEILDERILRTLKGEHFSEFSKQNSLSIHSS